MEDYDKKTEILYHKVVEERRADRKSNKRKMDPLSKKIIDIGTRLEEMHGNLYQIFSNPKIPRAVFDKLQKDYIKLLDKTIMYFDPRVVDILVNEENMRIMKKKMLEEMEQ